MIGLYQITAERFNYNLDKRIHIRRVKKIIDYLKNLRSLLRFVTFCIFLQYACIPPDCRIGGIFSQFSGEMSTVGSGLLVTPLK